MQIFQPGGCRCWTWFILANIWQRVGSVKAMLIIISTSKLLLRASGRIYTILWVCISVCVCFIVTTCWSKIPFSAVGRSDKYFYFDSRLSSLVTVLNCVSRMWWVMLCSYSTADEVMIWEQIHLPVNITQEPVGFTMKRTHILSANPSKGLKIQALQEYNRKDRDQHNHSESRWNVHKFGAAAKHVLNVTETRCSNELLSARRAGVMELRRVDVQQPPSCISILYVCKSISFYLVCILRTALKVNIMQKVRLFPLFMEIKTIGHKKAGSENDICL